MIWMKIFTDIDAQNKLTNAVYPTTAAVTAKYW